MAPTRLQKMMLKLQRYDINIVYKRGKELYIADTLSRAYLPTVEEPTEDEFEVMTLLTVSPARITQLQEDTAADRTCKTLYNLIQDGWPTYYKDVPKSAQPYHHIRDELMVDDGLVMRGTRVVIPLQQQEDMLQQLHAGHSGIDATKRRARELMYWPTMNKNINYMVARCSPCNALKPHQQKEPMKMHTVPDLPWTFIATDMFEWHGDCYSVLVDFYSGWYEIDKLANTTSSTVIRKLKRHFAAHGISMLLMSDNGSQYTSREFKEFAAQWEFEHVTSSPTYPQSNGLAERAVRSAKSIMEKCYRDGTDTYLALLQNRNMPRDTNLPSPAQRLMSRRLRTTLPTVKSLLIPSTQKNVRENLSKKRLQNKKYYDKSS